MLNYLSATVTTKKELIFPLSVSDNKVILTISCSPSWDPLTPKQVVDAITDLIANNNTHLGDPKQVCFFFSNVTENWNMIEAIIVQLQQNDSTRDYRNITFEVEEEQIRDIYEFGANFIQLQNRFPYITPTFVGKYRELMRALVYNFKETLQWMDQMVIQSKEQGFL